MEDFFKKHNFDKGLKRLTRNFNVIRYYPKILTREFINVGIILYDNNNVLYQLLSEDELSKFHCSTIINSKVLKSSLTSLDKYLQGHQELNSTLDVITNRYKNILDTSFQMTHTGTEDSNDLIEQLYYDYIGYKFDIEEKESPMNRWIDITQSVVKHAFKNSIKVNQSKVKGYNLDFINTKTKRIHHSLLGSIENKENVSRAFLNSNNMGIYDFLNTREKQTNYGLSNQSKLLKLDINVYSYSNDDNIAQYCENILN
ncbi:MAG: DUF3037 domain-containing protein [Campylobacterota bacterium]|nr:DUF3037 domain-containing protein [Campylobacterota bacterium]